MEALRNAWYCAGWITDLGDKPRNIRILDEELVIYLQSDGRPVALTGICPHRFAPLGRGQVVEDDIVCGYHGLRFDGNGQCVHNPHGRGIVPPRAALRKYPAEARDGAIWVWMGEPDRADPETIMAMPFMSEPGWATFTGYLHVEADYQLVVDNLMDLTHANYIHQQTVGVPPEILANVEIEYEFRNENGVLVSDYTARNVPPSTLLGAWVDHEIGDLYSPISLHLPSNLYLDIVMAACGQPRAAGSRMPSAHLIVPETDGTCHYFYAAGRDGKLDDAEISRRMAEMVEYAFVEEDEPMVRAVHECMGGREFFALEPAILETDAAGIAARRALARMIREEQASGPAA